MTGEVQVCFVFADIQKHLTELHAKYSSRLNPNNVIWSIGFNVLDGKPVIEVQFDILDDAKGATYWGIDLTLTTEGCSLCGYLYENRDNMVFSLDDIQIESIFDGQAVILNAIERMDNELSKRV